MKIVTKLRREFLIAAVIAMSISLLSSFITYRLTIHQVQRFAVVDLSYLNNEFVVKLSRYLVDNHASDEDVAKMVKSYLANLEIMLGDVQRSGNFILLQRQMVISQGVVDLTQDLEKALFESVIGNLKKIRNEQ